ncbi:MAG: Release factor glutamine methyltransferase [Candidatus Magasanikbacteria bacterium GW2011_GWC2_41_17]|uniref:Release factor glutamine methyltransferase n=1 Tax=Candidatus Magasanikbacteria bacterium GW2011_GWC2_41_17 TaxID=1619048 RepID=A0A0G0YFF4_9BACT|nr:MAG: Release factor glutamine methyltransferase [Candidatus Magasanikbacteria bacterium GW2011_GWC2_41_17]
MSFVLFAHPEFAPTAKQISHFKKLIARRAKGEPIAYLIGHKEFYGLDFEINKNVLIPRPETELMVEEVVKKIDRLKIILIDVGTGSGCIPIAILKTIDISPGAIATAKRNAKKHNVKIKFLHGNLLEPMMSQLTQYSKKNKIIITANLPYLTTKQYRASTSIQHEPRLALVADKSGLALYEQLLKQISVLSKINITLFFEIDPSQARAIIILIKKYLPLAEVKIKNDYAGKKRLVIIDCRL